MLNTQVLIITCIRHIHSNLSFVFHLIWSYYIWSTRSASNSIKISFQYFTFFPSLSWLQIFTFNLSLRWDIRDIKTKFDIKLYGQTMLSRSVSHFYFLPHIFPHTLSRYQNHVSHYLIWYQSYILSLLSFLITMILD